MICDISVIFVNGTTMIMHSDKNKSVVDIQMFLRVPPISLENLPETLYGKIYIYIIN